MKRTLFSFLAILMATFVYAGDGTKENPYTENWQKFAEYSSWKNNIAIQISTYNQSVTKNGNA